MFWRLCELLPNHRVPTPKTRSGNLVACVEFTTHLARHVDCESIEVQGSTVWEALEDVFQRFPAVKNYVVDEQGRPRYHVVIFVNGQPVQDREGMSDALDADDNVFVFQALSGG